MEALASYNKSLLFGARDGPNSYANSAALCMPLPTPRPEDEPDSRLSFSLGSLQINQKPTVAILNTPARHALSNGNTFALKAHSFARTVFGGFHI